MYHIRILDIYYYNISYISFVTPGLRLLRGRHLRRVPVSSYARPSNYDEPNNNSG